MTTVVPMANKKRSAVKLKTEVVTPEQAASYLDANKNNRPLHQPHVNNIADEIRAGLWQFNGDTIKISRDHDVLDGQHRLWACVLSETPIETIVVTGLDKAAFTTIDTLRRSRSFGDVLAVEGLTRNRQPIGSALAWLLRWQSGWLTQYRRPENRVSNRDIAEAWQIHPQMEFAMERVKHCRRITTVSLLAVLYYIFSNRDEALAEEFVSTLESPAGAALNDPFFVYRAYLLRLHETPGRRDPVAILALGIKAWNAAATGRKIERLKWVRHGPHAEPFPTLVDASQ